MENLRQTFGFGGVLSTDEIAYVTGHFVRQQFRSGEHFFAPGDIADQIGFVSVGACRVYIIGQEPEDDVTTYFVRPNQFVMDFDSFYSNQPATSGVQAVTECQMLIIDRRTWQRLSEEIPQLFILSKSLTEATLLHKIKDNDFRHFGTARQKYLTFIKRYPDLALSVPQHYIASYLQITPQSLSRIRKPGLR